MGVSGWVFTGGLLISGLYIVSLYNRLVGLKHGVEKAWA
ncbi:MAG: hypothetical protein RL323_131, partial [Pseudomonadota bacterium]